MEDIASEDSAAYDRTVSQLADASNRDLRLPPAVRPFLWLLLVTAAWLIIDALESVGPLDRAQLGWAIAMPLTLLLPAVTGACARSVDDRTLRIRIIGAMALACGVIVTVPFVTQLVPQCASVGQAVPVGAIVGLGLGVGLTVAASSIVAERLWRAADGRRRVAWAVVASALVLLVGGAILAVIVFSGLFPPGTCVVRPSVSP